MKNTVSISFIQTLYRQLNIPIDNAFLPQENVNWTDSLAELLHQQGYDSHCWTTNVAKIAPQITEGFPALGISPDGEWILLKKSSWNWIQYYNLSTNRNHWSSISTLNRSFSNQTITWLLIEPIQHRSSLSSSNRTLRPIQRLKRLIYFEKLDLMMITIIGIIIGIFALAIPLSIQVLINNVAFGGLTQPIISLSFLLFVFLILTAGLTLLQRFIIEKLERRLFIRTIQDLTQRFHHVRINLLDDVNVSDLANRFFDIITVQKALSTLLIEGLGSILQTFVATLILAIYHPWFLVIDILLISGMGIVFWSQAKKGTYSAIYESKSKYKVASWIETLGNQSAIFRLNNNRIGSLSSEKLASIWLQHRENHFNIFMWQFGLAQLFQVVMSVFLLLLGGHLVWNGEITIGQFVAAEFVVTTALMGFVKFINKMDTIYDLLASLDKIGTVLDFEMEKVNGRVRPSNEPITIRIEQLKIISSSPALHGAFTPHKTHILHCPIDISLHQFSEILCGLRPPSSGIVFHNDIPVSQFGIADRYQGLLLLSNDTIFEGNIQENITLGNPKIREEDIWPIFQQLGIEQYFLALPKGLTQIMPTDIPLLCKGILLTRYLLHRADVTIFISFFTGVPKEWKDKWLPLIVSSKRTNVFLEIEDIDWLSTSRMENKENIGLFGGIYDQLQS